MRLLIYSVLVQCLILLLPFSVSAGNGIHDNEIKLGQSAALDGPAGALGRGMRDGLAACFLRVNKDGGVNGRMISLVSRDDGYEPERAINNTRELIEKDRVFMLIGEVGTPTSKAVVPVAEDAGVPFFGPFTGAEFLRNPFKKYVINIRGSYYQEMEKLAAYLVDKKRLKKIACFYQNDGYGQAGLNGIKRALKKRGIDLVATGTYNRNTVAVKNGLLKIKRSRPDAVVMVGAYKPCAEFIKLAKKIGMRKAVFCNISFVGTEALRKELGKEGEGTIISQVVSFPWKNKLPLIREYHRDMKEYQKLNPESSIGFVSLEGYIAGRLFVKVAESTGKELTRESFIQTLEKTGKFDIGGVILNFGTSDHQGMDEIFLTVIRGGKVIPLKD